MLIGHSPPSRNHPCESLQQKIPVLSAAGTIASLSPQTNVGAMALAFNRPDSNLLRRRKVGPNIFETPVMSAHLFYMRFDLAV